MKKGVFLFLLSTVLFGLTACQLFLPNSQEMLQTEEKLVSLGIEEFQEEVRMKKFSNEWVSLWFDEDLLIEETADQILFYHEQDKVSFLVQPIEDKAYFQETIEQILAEGYEIIEEFPIEKETYTGEGYIYYSYEERKSIDFYFIAKEKLNLLIQFVIPDELMEKYTYRFEYMLETIRGV